MSVLNPTPLAELTDAHGRPYFLWDCEMTLAEFERALREDSETVRGYLIGKMMRQARPDDVFQFTRLETIEELWPKIRPYLGKSRPFWTWILGEWGLELRD